MTESEKRTTLVEGTPDQHADAIEKGYRRARRMGANREWLFLALILLGVVG